MKAKYRPLGTKLEFEIDGENEKTLFKGIAKLSEVFGAEDKCGLCKKANISFRVRTIEDNDFYELHCSDCNATFQFGQHKKGNSLFPKRKDENGVWLPNHGWSKYVAAKKQEK